MKQLKYNTSGCRVLALQTVSYLAAVLPIWTARVQARREAHGRALAAASTTRKLFTSLEHAHVFSF